MKNYHRQKASNVRFQNSLLCNFAFPLSDKIIIETSLYTKALRIFLEGWKIKISLKVRCSWKKNVFWVGCLRNIQIQAIYTIIPGSDWGLEKSPRVFPKAIWSVISISSLWDTSGTLKSTLKFDFSLDIQKIIVFSYISSHLRLLTPDLPP